VAFVVPNQISAFEAYTSFTLDLTRLISQVEDHWFTHSVLNELQPVQRRINQYLLWKGETNRKNPVTSNTGQKDPSKQQRKPDFLDKTSFPTKQQDNTCQK
jgi:hypothetical protein